MPVSRRVAQIWSRCLGGCVACRRKIKQNGLLYFSSTNHTTTEHPWRILSLLAQYLSTMQIGHSSCRGRRSATRHANSAAPRCVPGAVTTAETANTPSTVGQASVRRRRINTSAVSHLGPTRRHLNEAKPATATAHATGHNAGGRDSLLGAFKLSQAHARPVVQAGCLLRGAMPICPTLRRVLTV